MATDGAEVSASPVGRPADVSTVKKFLLRIVPTLLEEDDVLDYSGLETALEQSEGDIVRFIEDSQERSLTVLRTLPPEVTEDEEATRIAPVYSLQLGAHYKNYRCVGVVFIKRLQIIESDRSVRSQLRLINMSEDSPFETLHAYVQDAVNPLFSSYIAESRREESEGDKLASNVQKNISELAVSLLHLQQNIAIPEINLPVHPVISDSVALATREDKKPMELMTKYLSDTTVLNALQKQVANWTKDIRKVTTMQRDVSSGTALQEISFWISMEHSLGRLRSKRDSSEIVLTLDVLKAGKRFKTTISFDSDTGLNDMQEKVKDYNQLMKDFPIKDLLASDSLDSIVMAIVAIFSHLKKIRVTSYPTDRAVGLVEAISKDLLSQLLKVLSSQRLMVVTYSEFEGVHSSSKKVFTTWDEDFEKFQTQLRDLAKKRRDDTVKFHIKFNLIHKKLQERLIQMENFRYQHEQLQKVINRVLKLAQQQQQSKKDVVDDQLLDDDELLAVKEVRLAYDSVKVVDCLDLSKDGSDAWEAALKRYDERIDRVETRIAARLRDQLGSARNAKEMFRIFSRYNALFVRPHIRGAIREYQTQLILRVKEDIEKLHIKFKTPFNKTPTYALCMMMDIPPISSSLMWARQIEHQLDTSLKRVEAVLGVDWGTHVDGQQLKADGGAFKQKLSPLQSFEDWKKRVDSKSHGIQGYIFSINSVRSRAGLQMKLLVNFNTDNISLYKEARYLRAMGFRIPFSISSLASQANQLYPHAVCLKDSIRTYELTCQKIIDHSGLVPLVAGLKIDVQELIREGVGLTWESFKLDQFVQRFSECIFGFQEKVDDALFHIEEIDALINKLESCEYSNEVITHILDEVQKIVDKLNLRSYTNLSKWVDELDRKIESRLMKRLSAAINSWTECLMGQHEEGTSVLADTTMDTTNPSQSTIQFKLGGTPQVEANRHELHITNQMMYLQPPLEVSRCHLISQLHNWINTITGLQRIQSSHYQVGLEEKDASDETYRGLLGRLMQDDCKPLVEAYRAIEGLLDEVDDYVTEWLQYQSLWDMEFGNITGKLQEDLNLWQSLLLDIKKSRRTIDTTETVRKFGPLEIHYGKVQAKVNMKYDSWHKEIVGRFGTILGQNMQDFYTVISKARNDLENHSVDASSTSEAVQFITLLQGLKREVKSWEKQIDVYGSGQKMLERSRYQFPSTWLDVDNVEGEWGAFSEILKRKDTSMQTQIGSLQLKIVAEDKIVEEKTTELLQEWEKKKPVQGEIRPDSATSVLTIYEGRFTRLKEDRDNLIKAKEALELADPGLVTASSDDRLAVVVEELQDLKGVWSELSKIWDSIDELRDKPWLSVQPRKIRQALDGLLTQMKNFPARLKTYQSFEFVQKMLKSYLKVNMTITELKSEALKERHWKQLMRQLRVSWILSDLSLGQIWGLDLVKNEKIVKDVILIAQGEMALEEFLKQIREQWFSYELDLINYQNKCKLIRGWDDLFTKVKENINSVTAMKLSPYFKVFEDEALSWDERLNKINGIFDVWIDVQRRWVYLEGIFTGSADIKHLLPNETQRFQSIAAEFLGLMKKVAKYPLVMDVVNIPGVLKSLERLADLLAKIQKALGEYLERERSSFPRFYFVGDEDLLEIIGNSKNIGKLQKHFKKMFAGVATLILSEDSQIVLGLCSKEGEEVMFVTPVSIVDNPKINQWLSLVEKEMRISLATLLAKAVDGISQFSSELIDSTSYLDWVDKYQAQLVVLAAQVAWSTNVDNALTTMNGTSDDAPIKGVLKIVENTLNVLADSVLQEQPPVRRKKLEHLITELVHQRDTSRSLINHKVSGPKRFEWLSQMRFYFDPKRQDVLQQLSIQMANAKFNYGFEYLGVQDKLVQTPLTDRCYLTMTQALEERLGGSPFGPAGTGKTESVKALGHQLGRFVLVFNCDERFDFQAMGRIFVGLCQVGAWGCFDEFNRLEERMLSAVSQQIQTIQEALKEHASQQSGSSGGRIIVELVGKTVKVSTDMAIFITMNPGYAGRSNLPDNLKQLFRSLAMTKPDRPLIAQVMLYSQGFRTAETLAAKIVPFFKLCDEQLSNQSHYDFGLRALKSVLVSAGNVKRDRIQQVKKQLLEQGKEINELSISEQLHEQEILIQSVCETMVPKLVADDIPLLHSLLSDVFPGVPYRRAEMTALKKHILSVCNQLHYVYGEDNNSGAQWVDKVLQLYQIQCLSHGVMMVGPSGSGKSAAWRVLLKALEKLEGIEGVAHVIDPKAISKDELYGVLDPNTREWTDGLFTHILRKIIDNVRGELNKRQWIIFDGDVDPDWVENLNSVLDDNKLLTLPNGERLSLPPNIRVMFEVQDLKYATLATVSRCGMIWFSEDVLTLDMIFDNFLSKLRSVSIDESDDSGQFSTAKDTQGTVSPSMQVQKDCADLLAPHLTSDAIVTRCLLYAVKLDHIMDFTRLRALNSLFSMLHQLVRNIFNYNQTHPDFPLSVDSIEQYVPRYLVYCIIWCLSGDGKMRSREEMGEFIRSTTTIPLPSGTTPIIDYEVTIQGEWSMWSSRVPKIEVETHKVGSPDIVVPTLDTVRHESLLYTWLAEHKPIVLCGPPGSGKTMTLFAALRALPDFEVVGLNFSSATTPGLLLKTFDHYCEYRRTPNGVVMSPIQLGKWLVLFCDEINLPDLDKYGTQRVISFLRQIVEHGGFYRTSDRTWITLERIQFVGACNPPTDPGRKPLTPRFLRHVPVIYVDYPGPASLCQIYGTFNRAMLRLVPSLRTYSDPLTNAMVEFYSMSQARFTVDMQPHYIYSPREMTRWVRGIYEALKPLDNLSVEGLVRVWAHEALRLFQDRLVLKEERQWTEENVDTVAIKHFPNIDRQESLKRPILYSNWLTKDYLPVDQEQLRDYVQARLKVFYEEELDVPLVLFNEVLDHVLRIDRIFKQQQGHLLLIGVSGAGKTTLSRFVAWINGLSLFQIKVHNKYTANDFDDDLRAVLRRAGCRDEKIVFIMDESNVLDSSFLERMNTLLANGEVPGLFEGDEFTTLMTQCKEGSQKEGLMLDSTEELYKWFTVQIMKNLHVVFTMNPSSEGLKDRAATSPALFNRCVLNWFGDWSYGALYQVGYEFTNKVDLDKSDYVPPDMFPVVYPELSIPPTHREALVNGFVYVHQTLHRANTRLAKRGGHTMAITPRHYLDFINHYVKLYNEKRQDLEEQQLHLNVGLQKIRETVEQVEELQASLSIKKNDLEQKNILANQKLKQMVHDQQEAESKKVTSHEIQEELLIKTQAIKIKKASVLDDLSKVEPAVIEAQQAVKSIKKAHLVEVRNLPNPHKIVKGALESIVILMGESSTDWKSIRQVIARDNFVPNVVKFSTEDITDEARNRLTRDYLSDPNYNYETVNHASRACGPLVKWAIAQLSYADMLKRVDPLRKELNDLEREAELTRLKGVEINKVIKELEESIAGYKDEYAVLISQANAIKSDLENVEAKVERSKALLSSLGAERTRWDTGSEAFKTQMATITGDVMLTSAFMAYAGYFDQQFRQSLFSSWASHLKEANVSFRQDLARSEYLSNADERLRWTVNALPADDLCTENAIMLNRFNRYALVIDPSGQATEFIMNEFKDKKITKTSFLDDAFRKNLESALRFGNPLLVQDVESYDPILNPVLNREVRRTGGRVLITLGDQDIDLSPSFTIFLSTRDPSVEFPPDLCSRVTFVNFTVTRSSLQSQCLNRVLKSERPDVDKKRSDLLKLQGEFMLRLRHLEKSLLQALNEVRGRILDDDRIISQLENLKKEAAEVQRKVEETDTVMAEVEMVSQQYLPLSTACSAMYFILESLNQVHFLYQFSLQFFLDIFESVLTSSALKGVTDYTKRLNIITKNIFQVVYTRVAQGMLHQDRLVVGILLARTYLKGIPDESSYDPEFDYFLKGRDSLRIDNNMGKMEGLTIEQVASMHHLAKQLPAFKNLPFSVSGNDTILNWLKSVSPENNVPMCWDEDKQLSKIGKCLHELITVQTFRPDRVLSAASKFVSMVMGDEFQNQAEQEWDLASIVNNEIKSNTPILLCSVTGYDASNRVDDLAASQGRQCTSIAIGSSEGFSLAEKAISSASKVGRWVLLKNVHLAPQWLVTLEKKLHSISAHANFRLFLTMEINPKVPVNLLRASRIFTFEPPPGIRANLLRTFSAVSAARMCQVPHERARLYFLLAWLNAIILERLRYAPLGWAKKYEFNESDLRMACDTLDTWLDLVAQGRTNLPPDKVPWSAFRTLLSQCIYGGRIDNEFDQRLLNSFVNRLFTELSFDPEFSLVSDIDGEKGKNVAVPEGIRREQFLQWVEKLPSTQTPSWLGLPNNAEKVLLSNLGSMLTAKLLKMQSLSDDEDFISTVTTTITQQSEKGSTSDGRPAWMKGLHVTAQEWLQIVPSKLDSLRRTADNIKDPLFRFFEREVNSGVSLLNDVLSNLRHVLLVCEAKKKQTNFLRSLIADLTKGIIPRSWRRYTVPKGLTVLQWVVDFSERIKQLQSLSIDVGNNGSHVLKNVHVWLGGLFTPEAYITATRQFVAQANSWSLEELYLSAEVNFKGQLDDCSFGVKGLKLQGAECLSNKLVLSDIIICELPLTKLQWVKVNPTDVHKMSKGKVTLPIYLNQTREELLFTLDFSAEGVTASGDHCYYERGVSIISSSL